MSKWLRRMWNDSSGATAVEYGLILALIFLALVASVQSLGNQIMTVWDKVLTDSNEAVDQASV